MVEKCYNEKGQVAVLYSPGYGAGWSTWDGDGEALVFDRRIVEFVLAGNTDGLKKFMKDNYKDVYLGGLKDLTIMWLEPGTPFYIDEYDGAESVVTSERLYMVS